MYPNLYSLSQSIRPFDLYVYHIDVAQDSRHHGVSTGRYFDDCLSVGTVLHPIRRGCSGEVPFTCQCLTQVPTVKGTGRDSPVGIATRYGLDGPGIDADFLRKARWKAYQKEHRRERIADYLVVL